MSPLVASGNTQDVAKGGSGSRHLRLMLLACSACSPSIALMSCCFAGGVLSQ